MAQALLLRLGEVGGVTNDASAAPVAPARVLRAVLERRPDGSPRALAAPLIPLLDTTLLTNAPGEPNLWNQLHSEIESSDSIDVLI